MSILLTVVPPYHLGSKCDRIRYVTILCLGKSEKVTRFYNERELFMGKCHMPLDTQYLL
jgi:hypothetical protein